MPTLHPRFAGTTIVVTGTYYVDGVATTLAGANLKSTLKASVDDLDASAIAQVTEASTATGQITLTTGETGLANSGYRIEFKPAATSALITAPPDADLYLDFRVKDAASKEWIPVPSNPDDPVRVPIRVPVTRAS